MGSMLNALIGEYRIVESLGAGGMGEVYKAVHAHLGRVIAIKILSSGLADGPALQRFYSEAGIQASLRHPGVADYFGFYEYQGRPCIFMEYVDGETLAAIIRRRGQLPVPEALPIAREIAAVAAHFHAQGVVHRDLKCTNVKINSAGRVKILDFGIARQQNAGRLTRTGYVIGTPEMLSPEQIRGELITFATDIWQLGVMFYEMLTGRLPFLSETMHEMISQILTAPVPPMKQWQPALPPALERIIARCLEKDPARRYASAAALYQALDDSRQARRLPAAVAASALAVVLSIAAVTALARYWPHDAFKSPAAVPAAPASAAAVKTVTIDTADGPAQVFRAGKLVGATPCQIAARPGERIALVLRRPGFKDLPLEFEPTERRNYTYTLEPLRER
jgi:serine/threonine protein kinase